MVGQGRAWRLSRPLGGARLRCAVLWALPWAVLGSPLPAQVSPQQAAQQLQQNAALVRQRLQSSGLSPEQVRSRLQSAGYPSDLLDSYMGEAQGTAPEPSEAMLDALSALEPTPPPAQGLEALTVESGPEQPSAPAPQEPGAEPELELFGLDVFRGTTTRFQPLLTGPVPPNYRVGPGDQMVLVITGDVEFIHELAVTREGFVVIPQVGQIFVNELTMEQFNALLTERLGRSYSGIRTGTTRFDVTISGLRTNQVFVIGEVVEPGAYQLASVATILNGLYAAGGPTERGNFRSVRLQRFGATVTQLDLYDYLLGGDTQNDVMLQQGDVVYVFPREVRVSIRGSVLRPAIYDLKPGEGLFDLIEYAGGLTQTASLHRARVTRIVPPPERTTAGVDRTAFDVDLSEMLGTIGDSATVAGTVPLEPGDAVRVFDVLPEVRNTVTLEGNVWYPGEFGYRPGMTAWDLIRMGQGFQPEAYLERAQIVRLDQARNTLSVIPISLDTTAAGEPVDNVELEEFDVVRVFSVRQFEGPHLIEVRGAVRDPGTFERFPGMSLRDAVMRAGGLDPFPYARRAFISRLQPDSTRQIMPVELDLDSLGAVRNGGMLQDYDIVEIYSVNRFSDAFPVSISGEVRDPRTEDFQEEMTLRDLVIRGGGLTSMADLTVEISRIADPEDRSGGAIAEVTRVRIDSSYIALEGQERFYLGHPDSLSAPGDAAAEFELRPYDHVFVRRIPDFELPRMVTVRGQVRFPGAYSLRRKDERLRELIQRTGGLTTEAFAGGFRFYRNGAQVNVDLEQVLRRTRHRDDLILQPGDSMVVPEYNPVVRVRGGVVSESDVVYRPGAGAGYYIERAGGFARNADEDRIAVRSANGDTRTKKGFLFLFSRTPEPGPGSLITVGIKPEDEPFDITQFLGTVAQIAASTVAIVVVATR